MSLDTLLRPFRWVDEQILRQYTKLAQCLEAKGKSKYASAALLGTGNVLALAVGGYVQQAFGMSDLPTLVEEPVLWSIVNGYWALQLTDVMHSIDCKFEDDYKAPSAELVMTAYRYVMQKIQRGVRLPIFASGLMAGYSFITSAYHAGFTENMKGTVAAFACSAILTFLASSMYLKDSNPALLQKESLFARISQWWHDREVSSSEPVSLPVSAIPTYSI